MTSAGRGWLLIGSAQWYWQRLTFVVLWRCRQDARLENYASQCRLRDIAAGRPNMTPLPRATRT
eukprot:563765-Amphidinium_carterae.2